MVTKVKEESKIAFFFKNSWYHRKKELQEDGSTKYSKVGGFKTAEEAEQSYMKCLEEYENQRLKLIMPTTNKEVLFKDYLIYWFENIFSTSQQIESTTKMITSYTVYNLIVPNLPYDIKTRLITSDFITETLNKIDKLGKSTAGRSRATFNLVLKDAIKEDLLTKNPVDTVKFYKRGKANIKLLTQEEIKKFLKVSSQGNWYLEILLGLFCGLRKGEILGLKFSDFNREQKTVKIQRQLGNEYDMEEQEFKINKRRIIEKEPKTVNSYRTLRVPEIIWTELEKRKHIIDVYKMTMKDKFEDNDYISCQENGKPHCTSALNNYIKRLCIKNSIPEISVHGLRHMYATILIEHGVSLARNSALLGNSSIHTTFDFYCDVINEKAKITAFLNNKFAVEETCV